MTQLEELVSLVAAMRQAQRAWFKSKDKPRELLQAALRAEKAVDEALEAFEVKRAPIGRLF